MTNFSSLFFLFTRVQISASAFGFATIWLLSSMIFWSSFPFFDSDCLHSSLSIVLLTLKSPAIMISFVSVLCVIWLFRAVNISFTFGMLSFSCGP